MKHVHMLLSMVVIGLVFCLSGCGKARRVPRFDGIVKSHVDSYQSGTGQEFDLVRGTTTTDDRYKAGFNYGDPQKPDWTSTIHWEMKGQRGKKDLYEFEWAFSLSGGKPVVTTKDVEYGGTESVIVFQNEWQTISIEQGSIPLPKNSQPSVPGDA